MIERKRRREREKERERKRKRKRKKEKERKRERAQRDRAGQTNNIHSFRPMTTSGMNLRFCSAVPNCHTADMAMEGPLVNAENTLATPVRANLRSDHSWTPFAGRACVIHTKGGEMRTDSGQRMVLKTKTNLLSF